MKWLETNETDLIEKFNSGKSTSEISKEIGRTVKAIRTRLNKLGIKIKESRCYKIRKCLNCNEEKQVSLHIAKKSKFCSRSCSNSFRRKSIIKIKLNNCVRCGSSIIKHGIKYCSNSCSTLHKSEMIIQEWLNGHHEIAISKDGNINRTIRRYLIEQAGNKCVECGWNKINPITKKIPLTIDHRDGSLKNASPDNLKVLCPNCHSLTPTFGILNKGNGRRLNGFR